MTNLEFDSLAAFVLLATALIGAYAPVILAKWGSAAGGPGHRSLAYVLGNMLSAGVMLSAGFVHLLGESVEELNDVTNFPLATFLCGVGFLVTLLADSVMEVMSGGKGNPSGTPTAALCCGALPVLVPDSSTPLRHISIVADGQAQQHQSHLDAPSSLSRSFEIAEPSLSRVDSGLSGKHLDFAEDGSPLHPDHRTDSMRLRNPMRHPTSHSPEQSGPGTPPHSPQAHMARQSPQSMDVDRSRRRHSRSPQRHPRDEPSHHQMAGTPGASMSGHFGQRLPSEMPNGVDGSQEPDDENGQEPLLEHSNAGRQGVLSSPGPTTAIKTREAPRVQVSFLTAALMAVALCVHSLLEGAALGAQREIAKTFHIFVAILAHKGLAAYALGSSIVDSNASMERYWTVICLFAFATPAGIFIGFLLANVSETDGAAAISSLASGTFLYVALMEVIPRELVGMEHRAMKLLMLVLGFGAMSLLAIWA